MTDFGFSISKGRQIEFDSNDRSVAEYIFQLEPTFRSCMECGGCSATCTTGQYSEFSLREIQILVRRGENDSVRKKVRKCMLCGKCMLVCPRGVNTRNIITLMNKAFENDEYAA